MSTYTVLCSLVNGSLPELAENPNLERIVCADGAQLFFAGCQKVYPGRGTGLLVRKSGVA